MLMILAAPSEAAGADWVTAVATAVLAAVAVTVAVGGYIQFVVRQLVSAEVDILVEPLTESQSFAVVELTCTVTNRGSSTLVIKGIRAQLLASSTDGEEPPPQGAAAAEKSQHGNGWLTVTHPVRYANVAQPGFQLAPKIQLLTDKKRSRVFPGCTQAWRRPVRIPSEAALLDVVTSTDFQAYLSPVAIRVARRIYPEKAGLDFSRGVTNVQVARTIALGRGEASGVSLGAKKAQNSGD
jgi:hypothetical protein